MVLTDLEFRIEDLLFGIEPVHDEIYEALTSGGIKVEDPSNWSITDEIYDDYDQEVLRIKFHFYVWHHGKRYMVGALYDILDRRRWSVVAVEI